MPRQNDSQRAARDYMKAHPGTTYRQALAIVTGKTADSAPAVQGIILEGYAEGWSNADLNTLIATMGELVNEGATDSYFDYIMSSRMVEVAEKAHAVWRADQDEQDFGQDDDVDDNSFTGRQCEVDDCDRDARGCFCGAAHCDIHPHITDDGDDSGKCQTCGGDISDYEPGSTLCVWCAEESGAESTVVDGPRVEVVGRISARSLTAALYGGWVIDSLTEHGDDTLTAIIACPASMADSGFGVRPQSDRIRSFGGVRVTDITGMSEYHVHLSLSYAEGTGVGGDTIHAATLDDACEQASARYGENVVLVEGPDGSREML